MAEKSENKNADIFDFPKLDCNEKQNGNPYVSFIVRQCKWPSLLRKIAEIQKYCYHGNLTSQRPQNSPIMQFVTKSTQSHAQFLNGQWETAIPAGIYQPWPQGLLVFQNGGDILQNEKTLVIRLKSFYQFYFSAERSETIRLSCSTQTGGIRRITLFSKIQLVVYHQCSVLIGWATTGLYVIAF